jgi:Ser-tRNA(Ala) deacylase AlaX
VNELLDFLRAQLDEDEQIAREGIPFGTGQWQAEDSGLIRDSEGGCVVHDDGEQDRATAEHIARHDPARVLAEVDAKRRILDRWEASQDDNLPPEALIALDEVVKVLALPHADRPGYRESWKP